VDQLCAETEQQQQQQQQTTTTTSSSGATPLKPEAPTFTASNRWRRLTTKLMDPLARTHNKIHTQIGAMLMEFLFYYGDIFDYSRDGFSIIGERGQCFNVQQERRGGDPMWYGDTCILHFSLLGP
jgi:hypothetical protein